MFGIHILSEHPFVVKRFSEHLFEFAAACLILEEWQEVLGLDASP